MSTPNGMTYIEVKEKVYNRAVLHAEGGTDPDAFIKTFQHSMTELRDTTGFAKPPLVMEDALRLRDPVLLAAEIEALAAARTMSTLVHVSKCMCIGCQARKAD